MSHVAFLPGFGAVVRKQRGFPAIYENKRAKTPFTSVRGQKGTKSEGRRTQAAEMERLNTGIKIESARKVTGGEKGFSA